MSVVITTYDELYTIVEIRNVENFTWGLLVNLSSLVNRAFGVVESCVDSSDNSRVMKKVDTVAVLVIQVVVWPKSLQHDLVSAHVSYKLYNICEAV